MDGYVRMQDWDSVAFMKSIAGGSYIVVHSMLYNYRSYYLYICSYKRGVVIERWSICIYRLNNL